MKPKVLDIDIISGERIVREMTDAEYEQYLLDKANAEARANQE